jgi:DNA-directed RNA polymerase specialized sigma24 family protein
MGIILVAIDQERPCLDNEAFRAAIAALSPIALFRLEKKANYYALGSGLDGGDLLNEAIMRTLDENGRNCPADVSVTTYLANAMRSIADGEREKFHREMPAGGGHDEDNPIGKHADPAPSPATTALERIDLKRVLDRLQQLFADDPQALAILIGDMEGWSPEEIKEMEPMDDKAYVAARKRVRRTIEREFGKRSQI